MEPALEARDVRKEYGETVALDGASLTVDSGEVLTLVGPNGAGKTTLVRVLTGTAEPTSGEVRAFGAAPEALDRDRLGVLPQSFSPPGRLSARELLAYYAGLYDEARDSETVLAEVGLEDVADTWYDRLSGGQRRRACLGAALVNDPDVLVLDEPTTGIDPAGRRTVRRHVSDLADEGTAVLVTTHDMDEAERLADRVVLLAGGTVRAAGAPEDLIADYGGDPRVVVDVEDGTVQWAVDALADAGFDVVADGDRLTIGGIAPTEIGAVVEALDDAEYEGLTWRKPTLEDVYLALAGDEDGGIGGQDGGSPAGVAASRGDAGGERA